MTKAQYFTDFEKFKIEYKNQTDSINSMYKCDIGQRKKCKT